MACLLERYMQLPFSINKGEVTVKKKIFSCALVSSLLFSIGCYSLREVTKEELKAKAEQVDVTVFTKDSIEYKFLKDNYGIRGDTLSGFGVRRRNTSTDIVLDVSLSFADVTSIHSEKFDLMKSLLLFGRGGFVAVIFLEHFTHTTILDIRFLAPFTHTHP